MTGFRFVPDPVAALRTLNRFVAACALVFLTLAVTTAHANVTAESELAVVVRHAPLINGQGRIEGSIQQNLGESVIINGGAVITQEFRVPGTPSVVVDANGVLGSTVGDQGNTQPSGYEFRVNGGASVLRLRSRVDALPLPVIAAPQTPVGTRRLTLNKAGENVGDWATVRDLQVNGQAGNITVPPGIYGELTANSSAVLRLGIAGASQPAAYQLQKLTLNGQSRVELLGPVILHLATGLNVHNVIGSVEHPEWLQIRIAKGGVQLNSGSTVHGALVAPSGTITINGQATLCGTALSDRFILNGDGVVRWRDTRGNRPPVANGGTLGTEEDKPLSLTLSASDPDGNALAYSFPSRTQHGSLVGVAPDLIYVPDENYFGTDNFNFTVSDGTSTSAAATISIVVTPVNDPPVAHSGSVVVTEDTPIILTLSGSDADGDSLTFSIPEQTMNGWLEKDTSDGAGAGDYFYWPELNSNEPDSLIFRVSDGNGGTAQGQIQVTINPVADKPEVAPLSLEVAEDGQLPFTLTGTDPDGGVLVLRPMANTGPFKGTLEGGSPDFIYRPAANYNGVDSFWYEAVDAEGNVSEPALVTLRVKAVDDAPVAVSGTVPLIEDTAVVFTVGAVDIEDESLAYRVIQQPVYGKLEGAGPTFVYTPNTDISGEDHFTFEVIDSADPQPLVSAPATITLQIQSVNDAPVAQSATVVTREDVPVTITLAASDVDGDPLTYLVPRPADGEIDFGPHHGILASTENPLVWIYTPGLHSDMPDRFTFRVQDPQGLFSDAVVAISVQPRDNPIALPLTIQLPEDGSEQITLNGSGAEDVTIHFEVGDGKGGATAPAHGSLSGQIPNLLYTANADFFGSDSFRYIAVDSFGQQSLPAEVAIEVLPVNDPPVAEAQNLTTDEDTPVEVYFRATDVENDAVNYLEPTAPAHGTLEPIGPGHYRYHPEANFHGTETFVYVANDGVADSTPVAVTIQVRPLNDPPEAYSQGLSTREDTPLSLVLTGDDVDGDALVVHDPVAPRHGTLTRDPSNPARFTYTPSQDFHGSDSFTFAVTDGTLTSAPALVAIEVESVNDAPVINAGDDRTVAQGVLVNLSAAVVDDGTPEGEMTFRWEMVSGPVPVVFGAANKAQSEAYFRDPGAYVLRFTANDSGLIVSDELTVTVTARNQAPMVSAGADQVIAQSAEALLTGSATDDSLPVGSALSTSWQQVSGPGTVTFGSRSTLATTATFSEAGSYVLRLSASDSELSASDDLVITVQSPNTAPKVNAGPDQSIRSGETATLAGNVSDDGQPFSASLSVRWKQVSGPGSVSFGDFTKAETTATFSTPGTYLLQLEVSDSELSGADEMVLTVMAPENRAPVVSAGPDQTVDGLTTVRLLGSVEDDGRPLNGSLTVAWTQVSGPGMVVFSESFSPNSAATFPSAGTYVLRLSALDSELAGSDEVTIVVRTANQAPKVSAGEDQQVQEAKTASLHGSVRDDGMPAGRSVTLLWEQVTGPGTVAFTSPVAARTDISVDVEGTYVLRLRASDSELENSDTVTVEFGDFNEPPTVDAGPDQSVVQSNALGENLVINGSNESPMDGNGPLGWMATSGRWTQATPGTPGFPNPQEGNTYFYAGTNPESELFQDIDLSSLATLIDAGAQLFLFEAFVRSKDEVRADDAQVVVEYRDATNTRILASQSFVPGPSPQEWLLLSDTRLAPKGCRFARVRLLARRNLSDNSNDGFFDSVALFPITRSSVLLTASVQDDGLPEGASVSITWKQVAGPAGAILTAPQGAQTNVYFEAAGIYEFDALANDSRSENSDRVRIVVEPSSSNKPPVVHAGDDVFITLPADLVQLQGGASDDELPVGRTLTYSWTKISGEGQVNFSQPTALNSEVRFSQAGTYVLRLSADDGEFVSQDDMTVIVDCPADPVPLDVALVIDTSGSMAGAKLADAKLAAKLFVDRLSVLHDSGCLVSFSDAGIVKQSITSDFAALRKAIDAIVLEGGTAIHEGIKIARQELQAKGRTGIAQPMIVLLTDGQSALSAAVAEADAAKAEGIRIISIGVGAGADDNLLRRVSSSPTDYYFAPESSVLEAVYSTISSSICRYGDLHLRVYAGADIDGSVAGVPITLDGHSETFGLPQSAIVTSTWSQLSGPGQVQLGDVTKLQTSAIFPASGIYVLRLSVRIEDGARIVEDEDYLVVRCDVPCSLSADPSLVALWRGDRDLLDEVSGARLTGRVEYAASKVGVGFDFPATESAAGLRAAASPSLDIGESESGFTVEWWMNSRAVVYAGRPLLEWHNGTRTGVSVWQGSGSASRFDINLTDKAGGTHYVSSPSGVLIANQWQHFALVYERGEGRLKFYCNGDLLQDSVVGSFVPQTSYDLFLGYRFGATSYDGLLDEVSLYNRPLGPVEIKGIYATGERGKCPVYGNKMPRVNAGLDQSVHGTADVVHLEGFVEDDGAPEGVELRLKWRKVDGPGEVSFASAETAVTEANFSLPGLYVLELEANDSIGHAVDQVTVRVAAPCSVSAPDGLVSWWAGNGNGEDMAGRNPLALLGSAAYAPAKSSLGFDFNGGRAGARVVKSPSLDIGESESGFTVEWWMNSRAVVYAGRPLLEWHNGTRTGVSVWQGSGSASRFDINLTDKAGGTHYVSSPSGVLIANQWQHFALVYERGEGRLKFYCNGDLLQDSVVGSFVPQTSYDLFLGYRLGATSYDGLLDEVSLYNRPLGPVEIKGIYATGERGKCPVYGNKMPRVNAGLDQSVHGTADVVHLEGFVEDDGAPEGVELRLKWRKVDGPGEVSFASAETAVTEASFSLPGLYVLELEANDSIGRAVDQVTVRVAAPCSVSAPDGLVSWWAGNGNGEDMAGRNPLALLGSAAYAPAKSSLGFDFNGGRAGARVVKSPSLDIGESESGFTVEWWMNSRAVVYAGRPLLEWHNGTRTGVSVWQGSGSASRFDINLTDKAGGTHYVSSPSGVLIANQWQHFALVYERGEGRLKFYCNGDLLQDSVVGSFVPQTSYDLFLGYRLGATSYDGLLDEVSLYNRPLGPVEIKGISSAGEHGKCSDDFNTAPLVSAGPALTRTGPGSVTLTGVVRDDGLPIGSALSFEWKQISGPTSAILSSPAALASDVLLPATGLYVFELTASDTSLSRRSRVNVLAVAPVNQAPAVLTGADARIPLNESLVLTGSVTDDGLPSGSSLSAKWTKLSGPGAVVFSSETSPQTSVSFSKAGTYKLRLSATDSELSSEDEVTVTVDPPRNQAPVINAGADQVVVIGSSTTIVPQIEDDGLPNGYVIVGWQVISGPGNVQLVRSDNDDALTANFGRVGQYVLRLQVADTEFTSEDDVVISVVAGDRPQPLVQLTSPDDGMDTPRGKQITLAATVSQAETAIERVDFLLNGTLIGSDYETPYGLAWAPDVLGSHLLTARVVDVYGVEGSSSPVSLNVVNVPPRVWLTSPTPGTGYTPGKTITLTASAYSSTRVNRVEFYADGTKISEATAEPFTFMWTGAAEGDHQLSARLITADGQSVSSDVVPIRVVVDPGVGAGLVLEFDSLREGSVITAPAGIVGTVKSPILKRWRVEYRKMHEECATWTRFASGTGERIAEVLGTLDTSLLPNGFYELRLAAEDIFGRTSFTQSVVLVDGDLKVGHFTASFEDLNVPLSGVPISVTRTYDSRERSCPGDFGYGWKLDVNAIRLEKAAPLGEGWFGSTPDTNQLTIFLFYKLEEDRSHSIAITLPGGKVERFKVRWKIVDRVQASVGLVSAFVGFPPMEEEDPFGPNWEERLEYWETVYATYAEELEMARQLVAMIEDESSQMLAPPRQDARMQLVFEPEPGTTGTLKPKGVPEYLYRTDSWGGAMELASVPEPDLVSNPGLLFTDATGWEYTTQDGRKFEFDAQGRLLKLTDAENNALTFTHDGIFHSSGKSITFQRNADGFIESITDPAGNKLHYRYDGAGDLRRFYDRTRDPIADRPSTSFTYAGTHYLTDLFDARGVRAAKNYFDGDGRLYRSEDATGKATVFEHNVAGRVETITDRANRITRHYYDERGNITRTEAADGTVTVTGYHRWSDGRLSELKTSESITGLFTNDAGELVQQTFTSRFYYEDEEPATPPANDGLLRKLVDPLGNVTRLTYDTRGNLLTMTDARANASAVSPMPTLVNTYYPASNRLHTSKDAAGKITVHTYDTRGNLDTESRQVTVMDENGNVAVQTLVTDYDFNAQGWLSKLTDASGHATSYEYDASGNRRFERTTRTLADGTVVPVVTEHEYDSENRLTKRWDAEHPRGDNPTPTSETVYNELGKPWKSYDALRHLTESLYNSRGELETLIFPDSTQEKILYDAEGRREFAVDRRGKTTQFIYDEVGRVKETWWLGSEGDADVRLSASEYDAAGRIWRGTDARGFSTTYVYDAAGRRKAVINAKNERTDFDYDENGNQRFFTDAKGRITEHRYDELNRRVRTIYPSSEIWTGSAYETTQTETVTRYDEIGRRVGEYEQSPVGIPLEARRLTRFIYDPVGRLKAVIDALGQATRYTYDELGNQLTQTDARNHTTTYSYDNVGRRRTRQLPGGQGESTEYDRAGRLQFRTNFNGETTEYRYDALGRQRFRIPLTRPLEQVEWRYTASGQREWMIEANGRTTQYHYDSRDRLDWKATPEGTLGYGYNDANLVTSITSSTQDGAAMVYEYDELGRVKTVTDANGQATIYGYDQVGNLGSVFLSNGVTAGYGYDELNRLSSLQHYRGEIATGDTVASYTYGLYATGRRRGVAEGNGRTAIYDYDALWRLKTETIIGDPAGKNGQIGYGYDAVGNREWRTSTVAGLGAQGFGFDANDRLQGDTYDANGNTRSGASSQPAGAFTALPSPVALAGSQSAAQPIMGSDIYDGENRLVERTGAGGGKVEVVYDGDGHKVREIVTRNGITTTASYLVDELNPTGYAQVVEEKTNGTLTRVYTYGHDLISQDQLIGPSTTGTWKLSYYGYDGHGNVRFLTDETGAVTDRYDFDAFGTLLAMSGSTPNAYLYCGEQYDGALGLYYLRARLMNPLTGRFWTADSYEGKNSDPASLHKYLYCHADPVNHSDPSGYLSLAEVNISSAIKAGLISVAVMAPFRAYSAARELADGASLAQASMHAAQGVAGDFVSGAVGGALLQWIPRIIPVAKAGQAFTRAASSLWNLGWSARGKAIERIILGRLPSIKGVAGAIQEFFPVIDDFWNGIATSIKSVDLRAASYQSVSALKSVLRGYVDDLAAFNGATRGGVRVASNEINERLLLVAFEHGAASAAQLRALNEFVVEAGSKGVRIVFQWIP